MKKPNNNIMTIVAVALIIGGYAVITRHDRSENTGSPVPGGSAPAAVTTEAAASPDAVVATDALAANEAPVATNAPAPSAAIDTRFDALIGTFSGVTDKASLVSRISADYDSRLATYNNTYSALVSKFPATVNYNLISTTGSADTVMYSPFAKFFVDKAAVCSINPIIVAENIAPTSTANNEFVSYFCDRSNARRNASAGASCEEIIRNMLVSKFGSGDFHIGYSADEGLYYTYLISIDKNISVTALYYHFDDNTVLRNIGCDSFIYSGGELAYLNPSAAYVTPILPDYNSGKYIYDGSEPTTLYNLTDSITGILGSATSPAKVVTGGTVRSDDSMKSFIVTDSTGASVPAGVFYSSWFALD